MNTANKRIAKNTIYMYVRLVTTMVIGLYISRLVLEILGVSDFGLFSVVGGILAMFTFISTSLGSATSRFFNTEMGKPNGNLNQSFNTNLLLHICLAIGIIILAEIIGLWYIHNKLNIENGKLDDAIFVYHISIFTASLGIVNSPYQSLFVSHERFGFLAVLDIANSLIRLAAIIMLSFYQGIFALRIYAIIMSLTTVNSFIVFHYVAHRDWPQIIRLNLVKEWKYYREILVFSNWNLLATMSYMARSSGSDLILNAFFGTTMNGAFAISKNVNQVIASFTGNFDNTSAPQIIQSYAAGDRERYTYLANKLGRINILLFELIAFPVLIELDFLLHLWLGNVPEGAFIFTYLNILIAGMSLTAGGIFNLINASGKIKWFKIETSFFFLLCLPIGYGLFLLGYPAYTMLILFLAADIIQRAIQLVLMRYILLFDSWLYVREAYLRPAFIAFIMACVLYGYHLHELESAAGKLLAIAGCGLLTLVLIFFVGLKPSERNLAIQKIKCV